ncbi:MAG: DUF1343 domain-containing protein [Saprospiraceae bacterium]|nr:DUF1343 domain-containing protein [Saprospiraceae bacterium]
MYNLHKLTFIFWIISLPTCKALPVAHPPQVASDQSEIVVGASRLKKFLPLLAGKKVACVVNHASRVGSSHLVDTLLRLKVNIVSIMAPEHGFRGTADAGEKIGNETDKATGIPIISLYGKHKKPAPEELKGVDVVLFDLQDVGVRFFTYISTLHLVMEACAESSVPVIVLDRPNPHAHYVDGPILEHGFESFIGIHKVPVVYGMTIGEYAKMIKGESWINRAPNCELVVVPCEKFSRNMRYDLPLPPSPNLPNKVAVLLYPSLCFFEGSTWSVGRGTDKQFQVIGHPAIEADYVFTPAPNVGAKDPFLNGVTCHGYDFSLRSPAELHQASKIDLGIILKEYRSTIAAGEKFFLDNLFFDKLAGNSTLRKQIIEQKSENEIRESWIPGIESFNRIRIKYLIYE